jgi:hypothetical protein
MSKILEGAKQALDIAKCDHKLQFNGFNKRSRGLWVYGYCPKCHGTFAAHRNTALYDEIVAAAAGSGQPRLQN